MKSIALKDFEVLKMKEVVEAVRKLFKTRLALGVEPINKHVVDYNLEPLKKALEAYDECKEKRMKQDLSLVPIDELINELENRCNEFICAFTPIDFDKGQETQFVYGKGSWHVSCGLANVLNNDVLNNWNDELKTLQKLNRGEI